MRDIQNKSALNILLTHDAQMTHVSLQETQR